MLLSTSKKMKIRYLNTLNQASYSDVRSFCRVPLLLKVCVAMIALLLLLAGDVERNPGPTVVTEDKVPQLVALLDAEAANWYLFFSQLEVPSGTLNQIQLDSFGQPMAAKYCLTKGLYHWVVSDENPTYEKIIAVFNGNFLTNKPLAEKVEEFAQNVETVVTEDKIAPGPTVVTVEKVAKLAALINEEAAVWDLFLGQLGVSIATQEQLKTEAAGRAMAAQYCLNRGLHHWVVSDENPTYEKIIDVFNGDFLHNETLATKVEEFAQSLNGDVGNDTSEESKIGGRIIASYAYYICGLYEIPECMYVSLAWPPPPTRKVFNLAMIGRKQHNYGRGNDELVQLLYIGKVDEVMEKNQKANVKLEDLFRLDQAKRKVVLIEGAPGAGKSTLAWHICQKWRIRKAAEGTFFQEFKLVIFVQLRDPAIQSAKTLADILPTQESESHMKQVISQIKASYGSGVLFVLDGWDELPASCKTTGFVRDVIHNPALHHLHFSTLVITSRPIASGDLHEVASSRVEILGFTQNEVTKYFKESLENDLHEVGKLEDHVRNRPIIKASCYLPLNAAIVVHLFRALGNSLPNTLHGVFLNLVINCIVRHMKREGNEPPHISSLDDLPPDMQVQLSHICAMAYHGVMRNKVTFSEDDLKSFNIPSNISTLSLIQGVESFMTTYKSLSYNFLHLSVQELLTSYHIFKLPPEEQVQIFSELFGKPRFAAVFQYYAAFTKLNTEAVQSIVTSIIQKKDKILLLTLLHCLYEAQDSSLCQFVASKLNGELDLSESEKSLSPVDCITVGYFLHQCTTICPMTAKLSKSSFDSYKLELLGKELNRPVKADSTLFEIQVDLSLSKIDGSLTRCIVSELLGSHIRKLDLSGNPIQDGEDGLSHLCQALATNTTLVELNLSDCSLKITKENGPALRRMLRSNKTLQSLSILTISRMNGCGLRYFLEYINSSLHSIKVLDLRDYQIQDGEDGLSHLCQALTANTSLVELNLRGFTLYVTGAVKGEMSAAIAHLNLRNRHITGYNLPYISKYIGTTSAITRLDLSNNPIQEGKFKMAFLTCAKL